jgi:hypothetical protein
MNEYRLLLDTYMQSSVKALKTGVAGFSLNLLGLQGDLRTQDATERSPFLVIRLAIIQGRVRWRGCCVTHLCCQLLIAGVNRRQEYASGCGKCEELVEDRVEPRPRALV